MISTLEALKCHLKPDGINMYYLSTIVLKKGYLVFEVLLEFKREKNRTPTAKCKLLRKARTCNSLYAPCCLCLNEKIEIIRFKDRINLFNQGMKLPLRANIVHSLTCNISNNMNDDMMLS